MGRYFSRAAVALPLLLAASNIVAEEDVFKDAPGFYVELTGPKGETATEVRTINATPTVAAVSSRASAGTYGPLRSSDTMWSIASKVRPNRNVSVHQMMTAIYNKNPHAFLNNDINRLVNGAVLTIPTYAEISGVNKQNARDSFVASTQQTKPAKPVAPAVKPVAKPVPAVVKATPAPTPTPKPVEPVKTEVAQKPVEQTKPDTPSTAANAVATGELDQLRTQLDDSNEQLLQVAESNQRMKVKLEALSEDFSSLKMQLQEDAKIQLEIKELLSQQLAKPAAVAEEQVDEPVDGLLKTISSSWLYLGALIALPILIILVILSFWLRAKTKKEVDEQEQEIATSTSTLMEEKSEFDELLAAGADDFDDAKQPEPLYTLDDDLKADELTNANLANDDIDLMSEINLDSDDVTSLDFSNIDNDDASDKPASLDDINDDFNAKADDLDDDFGFDLADEIDLDDEPKAETPKPAEPAFNPDELLSADDLENIEFEEADDALFELNEGNDLVQEDDMIVELNEEDDILLEELSPSSMDDDLVSDLEPKAKPVAEPAIETPKGATDLDEFDFNMAEDDSPELTSEPVEIDAEDIAESADGNDLDWDFAEIDSDIDSKAKPEITEVDDIDDNDLLASQLGEIAFNEPTTPADVPNAADVSDDYIDIERLLEESGDESTDEPYQGANFDLGLDDFPDVIPDADGIDVDIDEGGIGQKLDLARAYLEIDDKEGAKSILEEIQGQGSDDQIAEITKLLTRLG